MLRPYAGPEGKRRQRHPCSGFRPRSPCIIAIISVRCKENPPSPGRDGHGDRHHVGETAKYYAEVSPGPGPGVLRRLDRGYRGFSGKHLVGNTVSRGDPNPDQAQALL